MIPGWMGKDKKIERAPVSFIGFSFACLFFPAPLLSARLFHNRNHETSDGNIRFISCRRSTRESEFSAPPPRPLFLPRPILSRSLSFAQRRDSFLLNRSLFPLTGWLARSGERNLGNQESLSLRTATGTYSHLLTAITRSLISSVRLAALLLLLLASFLPFPSLLSLSLSLFFSFATAVSSAN